ncbi:MAG: hypothetical protein AVDCRST_MAG47-483, partial [uncultured Nocardioidaceae bacterium]
ERHVGGRQPAAGQRLPSAGPVRLLDDRRAARARTSFALREAATPTRPATLRPDHRRAVAAHRRVRRLHELRRRLADVPRAGGQAAAPGMAEAVVGHRSHLPARSVPGRRAAAGAGDRPGTRAPRLRAPRAPVRPHPRGTV